MSKRNLLLVVASLGLALATQIAESPLAVSVARASTDCPSDSDEICQVVGELADLHATVDDLITDERLAHSLDVKVDAVTASVLAGRYVAAVNQLDAFENQMVGIAKENRSYTAISNVMKTKHDTVKNSISNIR